MSFPSKNVQTILLFDDCSSVTSDVMQKVFMNGRHSSITIIGPEYLSAATHPLSEADIDWDQEPRLHQAVHNVTRLPSFAKPSEIQEAWKQVSEALRTSQLPLDYISQQSGHRAADLFALNNAFGHFYDLPKEWTSAVSAAQMIIPALTMSTTSWTDTQLNAFKHSFRIALSQLLYKDMETKARWRKAEFDSKDDFYEAHDTLVADAHRKSRYRYLLRTKLEHMGQIQQHMSLQWDESVRSLLVSYLETHMREETCKEERDKLLKQFDTVKLPVPSKGKWSNLAAASK